MHTDDACSALSTCYRRKPRCSALWFPSARGLSHFSNCTSHDKQTLTGVRQVWCCCLCHACVGRSILLPVHHALINAVLLAMKLLEDDVSWRSAHVINPGSGGDLNWSSGHRTCSRRGKDYISCANNKADHSTIHAHVPSNCVLVTGFSP